MSGGTPQVSVVDDDPSVRKALDRLLRAAGLEVRAHASAREYLCQYDPAVPGCLVLDLSMPGLNGLELQKVLADTLSPPPIVFLTGSADVASTVQAMKRGAFEFLTKPVDETTLIHTVLAAIERGRADRQARAELEVDRERLSRLTPRELEVLRCVVAGMLNKQVAARIGTVEKTVKVHRAHIMEKLGMKSLADLVRLASRAGITPTGGR
jgi:FixJ family two-component response regulator